jgi:hypothetical protein
VCVVTRGIFCGIAFFGDTHTHNNNNNKHNTQHTTHKHTTHKHTHLFPHGLPAKQLNTTNNKHALLADPIGELKRVTDTLRNECGIAFPKPISDAAVNDFIDLKLVHQKVRSDPVVAECGPQGGKSNDEWKAEWSNPTKHASKPGSLEAEQEAVAFADTMRVFCAMEDGSALKEGFEWPFVPAS